MTFPDTTQLKMVSQLLVQIRVEKSLLKEVPQVELKPLFVNIKYELLGPNKTYNVIVNSELNHNETDKLLNVLKEYPKVIGYTIKDISTLPCA